ncbi:unnamed protein product [Gadus morhua 'NCC']
MPVSYRFSSSSHLGRGLGVPAGAGEGLGQEPQSLTEGCHSSLAQTLCPEEAPVDRPFWGPDHPSMPLPFDLADIVNRVESLLWRM